MKPMSIDKVKAEHHDDASNDSASGMDRKTVAKVANLARIKITADEEKKYAEELSGIMDWIEQLGEVNTDGIEPMTSVVEVKLHERPDEITDGGYADEILANAPETQEGFFVVPKVVE
jgi:aspartyl-tRNA(Asn)/glutamyl-tRNA(Gln) amidotransferase subunit C